MCAVIMVYILYSIYHFILLNIDVSNKISDFSYLPVLAPVDRDPLRLKYILSIPGLSLKATEQGGPSDGTI